MAAEANLNWFLNKGAPEISEKIAFLKHQLPAKPTLKNYQLTHKMIGAEDRDFMTPGGMEAGLQMVLQKISDRLREHLLIPRPIRILTSATIEGGKYQQIDDLSVIFVNSDLRNHIPAQKVAILAHELSHFYLYQRNIHLPVVEQNELLTEINAIYTGMGLLLLEGYTPYSRQEENKEITSHVGYLKPHQVHEALMQTAKVRKQQPLHLFRQMPSAWKYKSVRPLFPLYRDYLRAKKKARQAKA